MPKLIRAAYEGRGLRIALVTARFNSEVTDRLQESAVEALHEAGVEDADIRCYSVPGAVEIPLVARRLALSGSVDAIVALGAVIRGETSHYDYVCQIAADGCLRVSLETGTPVSFGVLTCENGNQALARIGKGRDAALVAIEMVGLLRRIDS